MPAQRPSRVDRVILRVLHFGAAGVMVVIYVVLLIEPERMNALLVPFMFTALVMLLSRLALSGELFRKIRLPWSKRDVD